MVSLVSFNHRRDERDHASGKAEEALPRYVQVSSTLLSTTQSMISETPVQMVQGSNFDPGGAGLRQILSKYRLDPAMCAANNDTEPVAIHDVATWQEMHHNTIHNTIHKTCPADRTDSKIVGHIEQWTTLQVGNIPIRYTLQELVTELHELGLQGVDFVYLQTGRKRGVNRGYCFLNVSSHPLAIESWEVLESHMWKRHRARKPQQPGQLWQQQQQQQQQQLHEELPLPSQSECAWQVAGEKEALTCQRAQVRWAKIQGLEENLRSRTHALTRCQGIRRNVWTPQLGFAFEPQSKLDSEDVVNETQQ